MAELDITEDTLLGGRIRIRQPKKGYRVNVDTLLLAAALPASRFRAGARVAELCCGVGTAVLAIAAERDCNPSVQFIGIERDPIYAALARENVAFNGLTQRVGIVEADALDPPPEASGFDAVFFNPPYDAEGEGRTPGAGKHAAHIAERPFEDWIKVWSNRMAGDATLTLIHRAQKLGEILSALDGRLGGVEVFPIRPYAHANAARIIVRARKGSRAPLQLLPGLALHPSDGAHEKYTPEVEAVLRGAAHIVF